MSIGSWNELLDSEDDIETKNPIISPDSTLPTASRQLDLNFERFNDLAPNYSSPELSINNDQNNITSTDASTRLVSPTASQKNNITSIHLTSPNHTVITSTLPNDAEVPTAGMHSLVDTNREYTTNSHSHADAYATWTPPNTKITGAALPWLSTSSRTQQQQHVDVSSTPADTNSDHKALLHRWNEMHQHQHQRPTLRAISSPTNDNGALDIRLPSISQTSNISSPIPMDPGVFNFSGLILDQQQHALDSVISRLTEQASERHLWSSLRSLDLSHQHLTGIHGLDTLVPVLEELEISHNQIKTLSGLPLCLKILKAASNRLTDIEGFRYLHKLEYLNISDNALATFEGIGSFYFLRTLLAENNKLGCCQALQQMHGLVKLKLRGNVIEKLKFDSASLYQLKVLDVSNNRIESLESLNGIPKLQELNLDYNNIENIQLQQPMATLRILKLNYNRLHVFDGLLFPNLKTLYLDKNRLVRISALSSMRHLDTLSLRDQGGQQLQASMMDLQDTRKLYLSGMPIKQMNSMIHFNNLDYLEICSSQLEELPHDFASQVPRLRILYLSHNYLKHLGPLQHHRRLQKLVLIDNRFRKLGDLLATLRTLPQLHVLDIRNNPINWKMYDEPLYTGVVKSKQGRMYPLCRYLGPEYDTNWLSRDVSHYQGLPEHWQRRRNMYRALFITECDSKLDILDNIPITTEELALANTIVNEYINHPQL